MCIQYLLFICMHITINLQAQINDCMFAHEHACMCARVCVCLCVRASLTVSAQASVCPCVLSALLVSMCVRVCYCGWGQPELSSLMCLGGPEESRTSEGVDVSALRDL